jgi:hypothetical protein
VLDIARSKIAQENYRRLGAVGRLNMAKTDPAKLAAEIEARQAGRMKNYWDDMRAPPTPTPAEMERLFQRAVARQARLARGYTIGHDPEQPDDDHGAVRGKVSLAEADGVAGDDTEPDAEAADAEDALTARLLELEAVFRDVLRPDEQVVMRLKMAGENVSWADIARMVRLKNRFEAERIYKRSLKKLRVRLLGKSKA